MLLAVELALGGMDTRAAWLQAGSPGGEKGLQNIRKRKRLAVAAQEQEPGVQPGFALQSPVPATPTLDQLAKPVAVTEPMVKANGEKSAFRLKSKQVDKLWMNEQAAKRPFIEALKAATLQHHNDLGTGHGLGRRSETNPEALARAYNKTLPDGSPQLAGWRIRAHVAAGRAGMSPPTKGPKPTVPTCMVKLM